MPVTLRHWNQFGVWIAPHWICAALPARDGI
jgi:hypothetical protein